MLSGILAHLRATLPAEFTPAVEFVEDIDLLADRGGVLDSGSVVVMPYRGRATPNALAAGGFRQRVTMQFMTGIVIRDYDHQMGETRSLQFDDHKARLEAALAGWIPPGTVDPCQLVDEESSPLITGVSIYVHTWETARFLTGA